VIKIILCGEVLQDSCPRQKIREFESKHFFFIYLFIIKRAKLPLKIDYVFWCVFVALSRNSESWRTPISFYDHTQSQFCFQIVTEQFASCTGMHHSLMEHEIFAIKFSRRNSLSFPTLKKIAWLSRHCRRARLLYWMVIVVKLNFNKNTSPVVAGALHTFISQHRFNQNVLNWWQQTHIVRWVFFIKCPYFMPPFDDSHWNKMIPILRLYPRIHRYCSWIFKFRLVFSLSSSAT
jgi:hypothetical protein